MPSSHTVNVAERAFDKAFWACAGLSLLAGAAYFHLLRTMLLPITIPEISPSPPVLMRFMPQSSSNAQHRGGLAALTPIEAKPLRRLVPRTGQRFYTFFHKPHLVPHVHLKIITTKNLPLTLSATKIPLNRVTSLHGRIYSVKPGGHTLVLALLMDRSGTVLRVKIMVPSAYPLMDMNYMLWILGKTFGSPYPPIAPGKTRWVDMHIHYPHHSVSLP